MCRLKFFRTNFMGMNSRLSKLGSMVGFTSQCMKPALKVIICLGLQLRMTGKQIGKVGQRVIKILVPGHRQKIAL